jgi:hypothetical protein
MNDELLFLGGLLLLLLGSGKKDNGKDGPGGIKPVDPKPDPKKTPGVIVPDGPKVDPKTPTIPEIVNPDNFPSAGTFYQVQQGDILLGIAKRALAEAGYLAGIERGLSPAEAQEFAREFRTPTRQANYANLITCSPWNDATVTTYGYGKQAQPAKSGRAIRMIPANDPNIQRMLAGLAPTRRINRGTQGDQANGVTRSGSGSSYATLWLPAIDLKAIKSGAGLKLGGSTWADGSSTKNPPRWVMNLGVIDTTSSEPRGLKKRGCKPHQAAIKVS